MKSRLIPERFVRDLTKQVVIPEGFVRDLTEQVLIPEEFLRYPRVQAEIPEGFVRYPTGQAEIPEGFVRYPTGKVVGTTVSVLIPEECKRSSADGGNLRIKLDKVLFDLVVFKSIRNELS